MSAPEDLLSLYRSDPVAFSAGLLGDTVTADDVLEGRAEEATAPWEMQARVMRAVRDNRRVAVGSGHSLGKTWLITRILLWYLLRQRDAVVLVVSPKLEQVKSLIFGRARDLWVSQNLGGRAMSLELHPDPGKSPRWLAKGFTSRTPEGLSGYHERAQLHIFEEASGIDNGLYDAVEGMMSTEQARWLLIGNPIRSTGRFADALRSPEWDAHTISCWQHPNVVHGRPIYPLAVAPGWPEERRRVWGESSNLYRTRVLGQLPLADDDVLIGDNLMEGLWGPPPIAKEVLQAGRAIED